LADNQLPKPGMRDISHKSNSYRVATAKAVVRMSRETIEIVRSGKAPKGDPIAVARVAATQAAKNTPDFIPYCHPIPIDHVLVEFEIRDTEIECSVTVKAVYRTGVEVEAMAAAAVAALNLYDLLKPVDETITIGDIRLIEKRGGKSDWGAITGFSAAVVTVSDRCYLGEQDDVSGQVLADALEGFGADSVERKLVPDETGLIADTVRSLANVDVILLTGGTGVGPRDVTPQSVQPLLDLRLPGVEEQIRRYGQERVGTAMLSRCLAGVMGKSLVICLPGSPGACLDAIAAVFPHVLHALPMLVGEGHDG
jgi:cyclic pyranopterin monophosphate synthase